MRDLLVGLATLANDLLAQFISGSRLRSNM
jgi:hypothetical protein